MKKIPESKHSYEFLHSIIRGSVYNDILTGALRLKFFDMLRLPISSNEVAEKAGFHPRNTELLLNSLVGIGLVEKKNGFFVNTEESAEFLDRQSPLYLGEYLLHVQTWHQGFGEKLPELVQYGPSGSVKQEDIAAGALWADSARKSAAYQYSGPAQCIAMIVATQSSFFKMRKMIDLGGGAGFFAMKIIESHPTMKGVVFEQPAVAEVTREFIAEYGMGSRVTVQEGNYIDDPIGSGYDLVFASATLNFAKDNLEALICKVYGALAPGGLFITHQDGFTHERTQPVEHLTEFLVAELNGMDFALPQGKIADLMLKCGFVQVRSFTIETDVGPMDIDIAKKGEQ